MAAEADDRRLEAARRSAANFTPDELERLYGDYGFDFRTRRGKHRVVYHPVFRTLRATMPNHRPVHKAYVYAAVALIRRSLELREQAEHDR